jgi:predicted anti-sigma-YlaC factor YlaD
VNPLDCQAIVELVTDYLEDALDARTKDRFDEHLAQCPGCEVHLDQFRETIRRVGRIEPETVAPASLEVLLEAFRTWRPT